MKKENMTYSFFSNMKYLFTNMWKTQKRMTFFLLLRAPLLVVIPFLEICLSREVINAVTAERSATSILLTIGVISFGLILCGICEKYLSAALHKFVMMTDLYWQFLIFDKTVSMDYENIENPDGLTKMSKAMIVSHGIKRSRYSD